jgi:hypothetical protein
MNEFTRSLLAMKMKDDLKFEIDYKMGILRKNVSAMIERTQWNDPKLKKDNERSTWFLNNSN